MRRTNKQQHTNVSELKEEMKSNMESEKHYKSLDKNHESLSHFSPSSDANRSFLKLHPRHKVFAIWYDRYMIFIALLAASFVYVQAAVILSNQSSENVSLPSYIILLIVSLSILLYAVLWTDWVLAISGIVSSVGCIIALVSTISYRPVSAGGAFTF